MSKYKTNKVKCDIGSYIHYWKGVKKSGKTTLFYDLVKYQYGSLDKGLLISVGNEIGYQALDGLVYAEAATWADLEEIVNDLVENKQDNSFEIVAIDTVDEMVKLGKEEVKRLHFKAKGTKAEFNACFGGYGAGRDKLVEIIDDLLARIRRAGYGIVEIGHTKIRDIKEKNGDEYQQLTSNLSADYDGIFSNKADIAMTIYVEKNIDEDKRLDGTTRYMYFRTDGFVDAGGRFKDVPERVEYGAENYVKAFEAGVKGAIGKEVTETEINKRTKEEKKDRALKAEAFAEEEKIRKENEELEEHREEYLSKIKNNMNDDRKVIIRNKLVAAGCSKLSDPSLPIEVLKELADAIK